MNITRQHVSGDRYQYDTHYCKLADGWAQVNTKQDASYYGLWTNPFSLQIMEFVEGDEIFIVYDNKEEYKNGLEELKQWQESLGYNLTIDCIVLVDQSISNALKEIGVSDLLV